MTPQEMEPTNPPPAPVTQRRPFPTPVQAVVITIAGALMAFFGCLGALSDLNGNGPAFAIGGTVFAIGFLGFLFGVGVIGFLFFRGVWHTIQENRRPPSPPAAPPSDQSAPPPDAPVV